MFQVVLYLSPIKFWFKFSEMLRFLINLGNLWTTENFKAMTLGSRHGLGLKSATITLLCFVKNAFLYLQVIVSTSKFHLYPKPNILTRHLRNILASSKPGRSNSLTILRNNNLITVIVICIVFPTLFTESGQ